jgi:serine protease Do
MKALCLLIALTGAIRCQTPGIHGHSTTMHTTAQHPGYLGVGVFEVTPERAKALKLAEPAGVEVVRVEENSAAAKAGVRVHDVVLEVNGQKVENVNQFIGMIGVAGMGAKMGLTLWREGGQRTVSATLDAPPNTGANHGFYVYGAIENPPAPPAFEIMPAPNPLVGIEGETLTPQLAAYFGVKEGVLVMTVMPKTPAEKAGLKAGDVILKVAGIPVTSIREISGIVRASHKTVTFTVVRNHKELTLNIEFALDFEPWRNGSYSA